MRNLKSRKLTESISFNSLHELPPQSNKLRAPNPLNGALELDLLIFLTVGRYFRRSIKAIVPVLRVFSVISTIISLILIFLFAQSSMNKQTATRELAIAEESQSTNYLMQQELDRLRSKTSSLELAVKMMSFQLNAARIEAKIREETLADFASESAGGSIIDTPETESFYERSQTTLFGIPIWKPNYFTPRKVIQPWSQAGECWAFRGTHGKIEIDLAYSTYINKVTLQHIPASASLTGIIESAPRDFRVLGKFRGKYIELGTFLYRDDGPPSQTYQITREDVQHTPTKQVMLQVLSNWGNPDYTCVYRFKVHGRMFAPTETI